MAAKVNKELCVGCGCCSDVCSQGALELDEIAVVNEEYCVDCGLCVEMCPASALELEK
ncbi:MAG: 4Fe-4S dicluster domain-containing protein [Deltaproteobacteria bacterium]|nr:4Fe-4S dicluster domain-containing protein [Deltaproteobacteria bacterium]